MTSANEISSKCCSGRGEETATNDPNGTSGMYPLAHQPINSQTQRTLCAVAAAGELHS